MAAHFPSQVLFGWVLFFSPSLKGALIYLGNMFGIGGNGLIDGMGLYCFKSNVLLLILCGVCATPLVWKRFRRFAVRRRKDHSMATVVVYAAMLFFSVAYLVNATYNPFLYFRF